MRVERRSHLADEQRARTSVGSRERASLLDRHSQTGRDADVVVRIDETGHQPAAVADGLHLAGRPLIGQNPTDRPQLERLAVPHRSPAKVQRRHHDRGYFFLGCWNCDTSRPCRSRRQLIQAGRHVRQVRETAGHARHPARHAGESAAHLRLSWPAAALLPLLALLVPLAAAATGHAHAAGHLRHHLAGFEEAIDQLIDVRDRDARTVRDAQAPRSG